MACGNMYVCTILSCSLRETPHPFRKLLVQLAGRNISLQGTPVRSQWHSMRGLSLITVQTTTNALRCLACASVRVTALTAQKSENCIQPHPAVTVGSGKGLWIQQPWNPAASVLNRPCPLQRHDTNLRLDTIRLYHAHPCMEQALHACSPSCFIPAPPEPACM